MFSCKFFEPQQFAELFSGKKLAVFFILDRKNVHSVAHHRNHHEISHEVWRPPVDENAQSFIKRLIPMDLWLYEYAKRLFEARHNFMKTGNYRPILSSRTFT